MTLGERGRARTGDKRLRVLFFIQALGGGGAEKHVVRVANHLDRERFAPTIAVLRPGGSYARELREDTHELPVKTLGLPWRKLKLASAVPHLRALIRETRADVVCSVMDYPNMIAAAAVRTMRSAPPLVCCVQVAPLQAFAHDRFGPLMLRLVPRVYEQIDHVVACSEGVREQLLELNPALRSNSSVIYNAMIDPFIQDQASRPVPRSAGPVVVACGRFHVQKGFGYLLDAVAEVRKTVPMQLWLLGKGRLEAELRGQAERLGITDAVRFLGFQDEPATYFAAADLFVLSSTYEGLGMVIGEAMACGTPVVATDCPHGPAEIIRSGETGILVPPGKVAPLAGAIARALTDSKLGEKLRREGRRRAMDFSASHIASQYGDLFSRANGRS